MGGKQDVKGRSLGVVLDVADVGDVGGHLVEGDLVDVVAAHRIYAVCLLVHYVLVVEEELVGLHELGLTLGELVGLHLVLEDVVELEVVVRDRLSPEHDHRVRVYHVQANEPDFFLGHDVDDLPGAPLRVQLLNAGPVGEGLVAHGVNVPLGEGAAVGPADGLRQLRKCLLPLGLNVEALTLPQVVTLQGTSNDINLILFLRDPEVDPIVHHLSEGLELALRDVKLDDLRGGHVRGPVKGLALVAANDQNILFVDHHDLALANLAVVDLERGPTQSLEVVKGMLIKLGKVE